MHTELAYSNAHDMHPNQQLEPAYRIWRTQSRCTGHSAARWWWGCPSRIRPPVTPYTCPKYPPAQTRMGDEPSNAFRSFSISAVLGSLVFACISTLQEYQPCFRFSCLLGRVLVEELLCGHSACLHSACKQVQDDMYISAGDLCFNCSLHDAGKVMLADCADAILLCCNRQQFYNGSVTFCYCVETCVAHA